MLRLNIPLILTMLCLYGSASAQVTADFSANQTEGCGYLQVAFTDLSSSSAGNIVSWSWDFGTSSSSTQNPSNVFNNPGTYTICLTATDNLGNSDQACKTDLIQVFNNPVVDFDATPTGGCAPLQVVFEDLTTPGDGNIVEWIWGVGGTAGVIIDDGTLPSIENDYPIADDYTISLTVRDENNCVHSITKSNFINVDDPPMVAFSADATSYCDVPFNVNFTNDNIVSGLEYSWDFGNGQIYTGSTPNTVVYTQPGTYTVQLTAVDPVTGCSGEATEIDFITIVEPLNPVASNTAACVNEAISFEDLSGVTVDSLVWDFGNGTTKNQLSPQNTYTTPGCYTVSVTRYIDGCSSSFTFPACIQINDLPSIDYSIDRLIGCSLPHQINATADAPTAISWQWDFGNGITSTDENPLIDIPAYGVYPVQLMVTDANGCENTLLKDTIRVEEMIAQKDFSVLMGCVPLDVTLGEASTSITPINSWYWEVTDAFGAAPPIVYTSTDENPTFTIVDTGIYNVRLEITNSLGCTDTEIFPFSIMAGQEPTIDFEASKTAICYKDNATFINNSSDYANGWLWDFGDGTYSEEEEPMHTWPDTGFFDVTLTGFHYGCPSTLTIEDIVQFLPPIAKFRVENFCEESLRRDFVDLAVAADSVFWDFGVLAQTTDTSSLFSPTYHFPETGTYEITMITLNSESGCQDTLSRMIEITDPVADFDFAATQGCPPFSIPVSNLSQYADTYSWESDGGDFSSTTVSEPTITFEDPGDYTNIQLIVEDIFECKDTFLFTDTIRVTDVIADITPLSSYSCGATTIVFNDQSSSSLSNITSWEWDFGNGTTSTDQNPTAEYLEDGIYDVTLVVTDADGCSKTEVFPEAVDISIPVAYFTAGSIGCTQSGVRFTNRSEGHNLSYLWDFGDGSTASNRNPTHTFGLEGSYTVCLTVMDPMGCDSTYCLPDPIVIADPVASFTADNLTGSCPPLIVNFENTSQNASNYEWDFGDDSGTSNQENPIHVYTIPGLYDVQLKVWSTPECIDSITLADYISLEGPIGEFDFVIEDGCLPGVITFQGQSIEPYNYYWDFGNGTVDTTFSVLADTFIYNYTEAGLYDPKLILANSDGCERIFEAPQPLNISSLEFDFFASDTVFCNSTIPNPVFSFIESSTEPITDFMWEFEGADVTNSTSSNPSVSYYTPGTYDVKLIMDNGTCRDSILKEDYIRIGDVPDASFSSSVTAGCIPFDVNFTDLSTVSGSSIESWLWTFGGGDSTALQNPTISFENPGTIQVALVVTSEIGCEGVATENITVHPLPEVAFSSGDDLCIGYETQINASFVSDSTGATYFWDPHPSLSCTDCLDPIVNPAVTTTYTLNVTDGKGCTNVFEHTVNVLPYAAPDLVMPEDTILCYGAIAQLNAIVNGGGTTFEYTWNAGPNDLNCTDCFNPVASPTGPTTYQVSVVNEYGCEAIGEVFVDVIDDRQDFIGDDQTICIGEATQLNINYGVDPIWLVFEDLDCSTCPDPMASPENTTTYIASVTSDNGCVIEDTVTVFVQSPQEISAGDDQILCNGQVMFMEGEGQGDVTWTPATTLSNNSILNPQASPTETTTYFLTINDGVCESYDTMTIEVIEKAEIFGEDQTICEGDTVQLLVDGLAAEFEWIPATDLSDSYSANPMAMPTETTVYTVIGSTFGCEPDTINVTIEVDPMPAIGLIPVKSFFPDRTVDIAADLSGDEDDYFIQWSPAEGLSCTDCPNPIATIDSSTVYSVFVQDLTTGCTSESQTLLNLRTDCAEDLVYAPNIFSPNGDGSNDVFYVYSSTVTQISTMQIFDRWGGVIFETSNIEEGWDGRSNGKTVPDGTYVYFLKAICPLDGSEIMIKGDISILK